MKTYVKTNLTQISINLILKENFYPVLHLIERERVRDSLYYLRASLHVEINNLLVQTIFRSAASVTVVSWQCVQKLSTFIHS